jgi:hypothetical protein
MSRRRFLFLGPSVALCALVLAVATPQTFSETGNVTVGSNGSSCVKADALIDHLTPGLFSGDQASSTATAYAGDCSTTVSVSARTKVELRYWDAPGGTWITCRSTDWVYGTTGRDQWGPTGPGTVLNYNGPACGPGYYYTRGYAQIQQFNPNTGMTWYGGYASSPRSGPTSDHPPLPHPAPLERTDRRPPGGAGGPEPLTGQRSVRRAHGRAGSAHGRCFWNASVICAPISGVSRPVSSNPS